MLSAALDKFVPGEWRVDPGDGAFYGPKVDITISDALHRRHQCATIQLDFQLPERFKLHYRGSEANLPGETEIQNRPVMIHRAILGSVERFVAILTEHFAGKWFVSPIFLPSFITFFHTLIISHTTRPFWISPRQVVIIPVAAPHKAYAEEIQKLLFDAGLYVDADLSDATLPKKIRNGEIAQYNFILSKFFASIVFLFSFSSFLSFFLKNDC